MEPATPPTQEIDLTPTMDEMSDDTEHQIDLWMENIFRAEVQNWLTQVGSKAFAVECAIWMKSQERQKLRKEQMENRLLNSKPQPGKAFISANDLLKQRQAALRAERANKGC